MAQLRISGSLFCQLWPENWYVYNTPAMPVLADPEGLYRVKLRVFVVSLVQYNDPAYYHKTTLNVSGATR